MTHRVLKSRRSEIDGRVGLGLRLGICISWMTTYIMFFALLLEYSFVYWYQKCVTIHHVPKCMSCHKAIVVITRRTHCFHECIYVMRASLLLNLNTVCRESWFSFLKMLNTVIFYELVKNIHSVKTIKIAVFESVC